MPDPATTGGSSTPFSFTYEEYLAWYDDLVGRRLRPALATVERVLGEHLDLELTEFERVRIRVGGGRIKNPHRLWAKMQQDRHLPYIVDLESIPELIHDLVGTRIVCNNLCDIDRVREIIGTLPSSEDGESLPLAVVPDSEEPHHSQPKPSGYRAYHVHLTTAVAGVSGFQLVRAELQVRTLLQDGWGELTHEDTYKPGTSLPPLAVTLARRMADLLAVVDEMAEDLRQELAREVQATVDAGPSSVEPHDDLPTPSDVSVNELLAETRVVVEELTKPASLAEIAQEVRRRLGPEVSNGWGGYESFKTLLVAAAPSLRLVDDGPGYVVPDGVEFVPPQPRVVVPSVADSPQLLVELRTVDRSAPAIARQSFGDLMSALTLALSTRTWSESNVKPEYITLSDVGRLAKVARDACAANGVTVGRNHIEFLLKALMFDRRLRPTDNVREVCASIADYLFSRAVRLGLSVSPEDRDELAEVLIAASP